MSITEIIFYLLSAAILGFGWLSVTTRKIFRAAICLLFSLTSIAGLFFLLQYEFIAAVQIVVYVGGIVVLIIFSIFLTQQYGTDMEEPALSRKWLGGVSVVLGLIVTSLLIVRHEFLPAVSAAAETDVANIGRQLLSTEQHGFILPFEAVSILLLAAMIGAIVIAMKQPHPVPSPANKNNGASENDRGELIFEKEKTEAK